jgi:DNA-directed RNA polymerase specialized sigma24 family protein
MRAEEQFDSFYLKTRRALVHQTFALTGDITAAQRAVRDAYVAAWHHWRKVKALEDPREWVRPRAWAQAQRRHSARLWQRTRDLSAEDRAVLDALHKLPVAERRALLMVHLAGASPQVAARELNVTQQTLEAQVRSATTKLAVELGTDAASVREPLASLDEAASHVSLPRAGAIRREGRNRRRTHTVVGAAAVTFLAVATGAFAHEPTDERPAAGSVAGSPADGPRTQRGLPEESSTLPSAADLLEPRDLSGLERGTRWQEVQTHDNTAGKGINYVCQQERFADPEGLATLVRVMKPAGKSDVQSVVQTVEISENADAAAATYSTVLSWFATCQGGAVHLRQTYDVADVADHATILELESWARPRNYYTVAVAEVGQVVTTSVVRTVNGTPPRATAVAQTLATATESICKRAGNDDCTGSPDLQATAPAPSGEETGMLATVDMPPLTGVMKPWVGTTPAATTKNLAATSCDHADFRKEGAVRNRTRTFLVPEARLPARFGLTETYGTFKSSRAAADFLTTIRKRFRVCEDRDLATKVVSVHTIRSSGLDGSTWRLNTELSQSSKVVFDVGFVRRGSTVAQVSFVPTGDVDLATGAFGNLVVRAGQRLAELE